MDTNFTCAKCSRFVFVGGNYHACFNAKTCDKIICHMCSKAVKGHWYCSKECERITNDVTRKRFANVKDVGEVEDVDEVEEEVAAPPARKKHTTRKVEKLRVYERCIGLKEKIDECKKIISEKQAELQRIQEDRIFHEQKTEEIKRKLTAACETVKQLNDQYNKVLGLLTTRTHSVYEGGANVQLADVDMLHSLVSQRNELLPRLQAENRRKVALEKEVQAIFDRDEEESPEHAESLQLQIQLHHDAIAKFQKEILNEFE